MSMLVYWLYQNIALFYHPDSNISSTNEGRVQETCLSGDSSDTELTQLTFNNHH